MKCNKKAAKKAAKEAAKEAAKKVLRATDPYTSLIFLYVPHMSPTSPLPLTRLPLTRLYGG